MTTIYFTTERGTNTQYSLVYGWGKIFTTWFLSNDRRECWNQIVLLTDECVWELYEKEIRTIIAPLDRQIVPLVLPQGEKSKDFSVLHQLVVALVEHRIHRRDLLICIGGGVCCDIGGLLALLYMRGMEYINIPTSLMAQLDGAIGGKVGANFGIRKNLLGGFHHPLLVIIDPVFLDTLPTEHYESAFAEAVKLAMIFEDQSFLEFLEDNSHALLNRSRSLLLELLERCLRSKLDLITNDPYELNLNRSLNLGHTVAHALERLPSMPDGRQPFHGEAVAIGLATKIRYAFLCGFCSIGRATRLLSLLQQFKLPLIPGNLNKEEIKNQIDRISEHRGGEARLVVPTTEGGVNILSEIDPDKLVECLSPIAGIPL